MILTLGLRDNETGMVHQRGLSTHLASVRAAGASLKYPTLRLAPVSGKSTATKHTILLASREVGLADIDCTYRSRIDKDEYERYSTINTYITNCSWREGKYHGKWQINLRHMFTRSTLSTLLSSLSCLLCQLLLSNTVLPCHSKIQSIHTSFS